MSATVKITAETEIYDEEGKRLDVSILQEGVEIVQTVWSAEQHQYIPNVKSGLPERTPENSYEGNCFKCGGEKTILNIHKKHVRCPVCWGNGTITYYKDIE